MMNELPLRQWTMDQLLAEKPEAADVLADHGVDPRVRCNHAVRHYLKLGKVLGRNCPVDDREATFNDLEALFEAPSKGIEETD